MKRGELSTPTHAPNAATYRKAARIVERGECEFSCWAIAIAGGFESEWDHAGYRPPVLTDYVSTFLNSGDFQWQFEETSNGRDLRILALCFMAALVEAGDV